MESSVGWNGVLTNNLDLNAREVCDVYKKRWDIEVFFRFIKQELSFKHFISRSLNWIKVMTYMTLITSILLLAYKHKNKIEWYKIAKQRFILDLETSLMRDFSKIVIIACNWDISKVEKFFNRLSG